MSIEAISAVWKTTNQSGVQLLALIALADYAHDDGTNAFPKIETLMKKLRYKTDRGVQKVIEPLIESGELVRHNQKGPGGVNLFDIVFQDGSNYETIKNRCEMYGTLAPAYPEQLDGVRGEQTDTPPRTNGHPKGEQMDGGATGEQMDGQNHEPLIDPSEEESASSKKTKTQQASLLADAIVSVCGPKYRGGKTQAAKNRRDEVKETAVILLEYNATPEQVHGFWEWSQKTLKYKSRLKPDQILKHWDWYRSDVEDQESATETVNIVYVPVELEEPEPPTSALTVDEIRAMRKRMKSESQVGATA